MLTAHSLANQESSTKESTETVFDQLNDIELQLIAGGAATVNVV